MKKLKNKILKICLIGLIGAFSNVNAQTTTQTFNYTGSIQSFTVPSGVTSISITAIGAEGGSARNNHRYYNGIYMGGDGGSASGDLAVTPGNTIYFVVGGKGQHGASGGYNGGGKGHNNYATTTSTGGGASDVRVGGTALTNRVLVAGGGGGAEWAGGQRQAGTGGGLSGGIGYGDWPANSGNPGTQTAGGTGGPSSGWCSYVNASPGTLGNGGRAGSQHSGGGGGGYYGGGAGGCNGHGAGGSGYIGGVTNGSTSNGGNRGNGRIVITYTQCTPPTISVSASASEFCAGSSVTLTASSNQAGTYLWSNNATTQSITVNAGGTYSVTQTNSGGCSSNTASVSVTENALPVASISASADEFCSGASVTLTASSDQTTTYEWSTNETTTSIDVSNGGTYSVTATNATTGCSGTAETLITENALPVTSISTSADEFCAGSSVTLTASSDQTSTFEWNTSETTTSIEVTSGGTYSVTATNTTTGCTGTDETAITEHTNPVASIAASASEFCSGSSVTLTASSDQTSSYLWNTGETTATIEVSDGGTYSVTVTNTTTGCTGSAETTVVENSNPYADAGSDINLYYGYTPLASGTLTGSASGGTSGYSYAWSNNATTQNITVSPTSTTTYTLTVTDSKGCIGTDQATANVQDVRCGKKNNKVLVCHNTGSSKKPTVSICISANAVADHINNHGCTVGECSFSWGDIVEFDSTASLTLHPNPVTSSSSVTFSIPSDGNVSVKVYNNSGTCLGTIYSGSARSGNVYNYSVDYNLFATAGTYFIKLVSGTESVSVTAIKN